jgi:hypothetical protein
MGKHLPAPGRRGTKDNDTCARRRVGLFTGQDDRNLVGLGRADEPFPEGRLRAADQGGDPVDGQQAHRLRLLGVRATVAVGVADGEAVAGDGQAGGPSLVDGQPYSLDSTLSLHPFRPGEGNQVTHPNRLGGRSRPAPGLGEREQKPGQQQAR